MKTPNFTPAGLCAALLTLAALMAAGSSAAAQSERSTWSIGPVIGGENYSYRMPPAMRPTEDGASFDFPYSSAADGHVHYVTTSTRSLAGAQAITIRYRIDAAPGTRFVPEEHPSETATLSLYFQRAGDRWTMRTPNYRWYVPHGRDVPLRPGTHEVTVSLSEPWIAMAGGTSHAHARDFRAALAGAERIGFVFGSESGRGHGVYATGPARFTLLDFRVE